MSQIKNFQSLRDALERRCPTAKWTATHNDQQQLVQIDGGVGTFFVSSGVFQITGTGRGRQELQEIKDRLESGATSSMGAAEALDLHTLCAENKVLSARVADLEMRVERILQKIV